LVGDAEHLPIADKAFPYVVSSHVLEHVPDFQRGVAELARVSSHRVIAAIPTCLNPCAWVLLGADKYWTLSRRSIYAIFLGFLRMLWALVTFQEGINEGYVGNEKLIHIWRFPRAGKARLTRGGLKVLSYRGSSYIFPYLPFLVPISRALLAWAWVPGIRNFGYGTTYVCEPKNSESLKKL
jgi:SAM-dependent methyltransferase